jgi:Cof subfamily protein (haloacid dehalogenase superfamily)
VTSYENLPGLTEKKASSDVLDNEKGKYSLGGSKESKGNINLNTYVMTKNYIEKIEDGVRKHTKIVCDNAGNCAQKEVVTKLVAVSPTVAIKSYEGSDNVIRGLDTTAKVDNAINSNNLTKLLAWCASVSTAEVFAYTYEKSIKLSGETTLNQAIYKVVLIDTENNILNIRNAVSRDIIELFEITSSESTRIEFVQKGITKQQAILTLLNYLNIDKSEMIAIGDGENDISMLELAEMPVAMGNANNEVKKYAKLITDTNDNSGVGKALKQLLEL